MANDIDTLQTAIQHRFRDPSLLKQALTHRSAGHPNNERLEFLGDAVLGMVVAEMLFVRFPDAPEGELSIRRNMIINKKTLAQVGRELNMGACITLSTGERKSGGGNRDSILADALEALVAAVYLDGGLDAVRHLIKRHILSPHLHSEHEGVSPASSKKTQPPPNPNQLEHLKDSKTRLQEYTQAARIPLPHYEVLEMKGKGHRKEFTVSCEVESLSEQVVGHGRSKRAAEQDAARQALLLVES